MFRTIASAHDHLLKLLLAQPGMARAFFAERLPARVATWLDGAPEQLPTEFVVPKLRSVHPDLVFRLPLRNPKPPCFGLIEHKSRPDGQVGFQHLRYADAIWQNLREQAGRSAGLPLIIPMVVYNGIPAWALPRRFSDGLTADPGWQDLSLDFPIEVVDLRRGDEMALSSVPGLRGGLRLLRHGVRGPPPGLAMDCLHSVLADLRWMPDGFLEEACHYILDRWEPISSEDLVEALRAVMPDKEEAMLSKAAREFQAEGRAKGREEGRVEGRAEGAVLGEARALMHQLEHRFGPLPEAQAERIRRASVEQLEEWLVRLLDAKSLEEVFGRPPLGEPEGS